MIHLKKIMQSAGPVCVLVRVSICALKGECVSLLLAVCSSVDIMTNTKVCQAAHFRNRLSFFQTELKEMFFLSVHGMPHIAMICEDLAENMLPRGVHLCKFSIFSFLLSSSLLCQKKVRIAEVM